MTRTAIQTEQAPAASGETAASRNQARVWGWMTQ